MQLTKHFSLKEATQSATAKMKRIGNQPSEEHLENIKFTAIRMEAVRQILGNYPLMITSWYRSKELNDAIPGSSKTSQHSKGQAVDFRSYLAGTPRQICQILMANKSIIKYDQLILEPTWVHISFVSGHARGNELTCYEPGKYSQGISSEDK
jgi:hypothetical protein